MDWRVFDWIDNELSSMRRQIDSGHPVTKDQIAAVRRTLMLKMHGVDAALDRSDPTDEPRSLNEWRARLLPDS